MTSEESTAETLHCGNCGHDHYHIKFDLEGHDWAVCAECGRPSSVVGIGEEKQRAWEEQNE